MTTAMTTTQPTQDVAVQRVRYEPTAAIGSAKNLKSLFDQQRDSLAAIMPKHVTPDRLLKTLLVACNRNPDLFQCTQMSVFETISRAGELGLDLSGTLGEAYAVPFNNRIKIDGQDVWVKQCQLIIGYRGLAKLARQSGEIKRIEAEVVYTNDDFKYRKGTSFALDFAPCLTGPRGEPIGAYALTEFKDGGLQAEFMAVADIEAIRKRSKSGCAKDGSATGPWKSDWSEMAKKTVFRRLAKWLPLSADKASAFHTAVETDNEDYGPEVLEVEKLTEGNDGTTRSQRLLDKIKARGGEIDMTAPEAGEPAETQNQAEQAPPQRQAEASHEGPTMGERCIIRFAEQYSLNDTDAESTLDDFAKRVLGGRVRDLGQKELATLERHIAAGDIVPKKK